MPGKARAVTALRQIDPQGGFRRFDRILAFQFLPQLKGTGAHRGVLGRGEILAPPQCGDGNFVLGQAMMFAPKLGLADESMHALEPIQTTQGVAFQSEMRQLPSPPGKSPRVPR